MLREPKKLKFLKEKLENTKKLLLSLPKPEESSLTTLKALHSYKKEKSVPLLKSVPLELL
jgi:hypothetical protein